MEKQVQESQDSKPTKLIHVQIADGTEADVYEIGAFLRKYADEAEEELGYKLKAIVTNDRIVLQDVDAMIRELWKLKKQMELDKTLEK
jgi:hypothetical protein